MDRQSDCEPVLVRVNRRLALAAVGLFGIILFGVISRGISTDNIESTVIGAFFIGLPFAFYARRGFQRGPVLIFDDATFTDCKFGEVIPWGNVFDDSSARHREGSCS